VADRVQGRKRRLLVRGLILLLLGTVLGAGAFGAACGYLGRTPVELIDYVKRRLQGHQSLEVFALPVLDVARSVLSEQDEIELALPFAVPALPPNPMRAASAPEATDPRVIRVGLRRAVFRIADAARIATNGSVIEIDPGDYIGDVAVWTQSDLTIRGVGVRVRLIAGGADAEGKAIWVFRSPRATVENIEFDKARVEDGNGAGIRLESGHLTVRRCRFWSNQNGILTAGEKQTTLEIENSEFGYNGAGDGITHAIYVGPIDMFRLSGSYLHHGNVGHLVKSRAKVNRIEYNRLTDESGGRSSYELEFPNGGLADVVGNIIQQGTSGRNSTMVSFGAEGYRWPRNELRFVHNTVINDQRFGGTFVRVWPGADRAVLLNNLFVGSGRIIGVAGADKAGNADAEWSQLVRPSREDYRLNGLGRERLGGHTLAPVDAALEPRAEYVHPAGTQPLSAPPLFPGALQSGPP
jgi:hypothetical protein